MRILYIVTRSFMGGAQAHLLELIRAYSQDNEIGLISGEKGYFTDEAALAGAKFFAVSELVREPAPHLDYRAAERIEQIIKCFQPQIVHCHTWKAGLLGRWTARRAGIPSIYTPHGWRFSPGARVREKLIAFPSEWAGSRIGNAVIAVSQFECDLAFRLKVAPARKVHLIHNGIQDSPHRANPGEGGDVHAVMVARFMNPKDHSTVLKAMAGLPAALRLSFVGDGPTLPAVRDEAERLGVAERVAFLGERRGVDQILASAHVFILSSRHEALSISILEALRAGLPVVASNVGGVPECVRDGQTGTTFAAGDVNQLRRALIALVQSRSMRTAMGAAARELYEQQFTVDRMIEKTFSLYTSLARPQESSKESQVTAQTFAKNSVTKTTEVSASEVDDERLQCRS